MAIVLQDGWCLRSTTEEKTMADHYRRLGEELTQEILLDNPGFLSKLVERVIQKILEVEMT
jgi:hypothetical protein